MPDRKPRKFAPQNPIDTLRRSPRFLPENQITAEIKGTPKVTAKIVTASGSLFTPPDSCVTNIENKASGISQNGRRKDPQFKGSVNSRRKSARLDSRANLSCPDVQKQCVIEKRVTRSSVRGCRFVDSQDKEYDGFSGNEQREVTELKSFENSGEGCRRSARLVNRANVRKSERVLFPNKQCVIEKRVTRGSIRQNNVVIDEVGVSDSGNRVKILSKEPKAKSDLDSCKENIGNIRERVAKSSGQRKMSRLVDKASNVCTFTQQEVVISNQRKSGGNEKLSKPYSNRKVLKDCSNTIRSGEENCKRKTNVGKKKHQSEEELDIVDGWTEEQELALQRAYFTIKPTPRFWKKVARMIPGKSAKECFDRIHSEYSTPLQLPARSRPQKKELSPILFSASKLLSPTKKIKKRSSRKTTLAAQKTIRQLLQKQHNEDQDYEADLFSVLEPTVDSSPLIFRECTPFSSPAPSKGSPFLTTCQQMSSSVQRKQPSRLSSSQKAGFVSPPVLKQIKNKALHEKYIDQLHCRDAKRKAAASRKAKCIKDQIAENMSKNLVKVAKDALLSDAQDAIHKLRSLQSDANDSVEDNDDDGACFGDENEDEDDLF